MTQFNAGDKVYAPNVTGRILTLKYDSLNFLVFAEYEEGGYESPKFDSRGYEVKENGKIVSFSQQLFKCTPENEKALNILYSDVHFQRSNYLD